MGRAYTADLRGRVLDAVEAGSSARSAAARFGVGVATAIRWVGEGRGGGRRQGPPIRWKLDPHEVFLLGLVEETVDITLAEMQARLAGERGVQAGIGTLWRFFDRRGVTVKKSPGMRASRTVPTSARRARPGSRASRSSIPNG